MSSGVLHGIQVISHCLTSRKPKRSVSVNFLASNEELMLIMDPGGHRGSWIGWCSDGSTQYMPLHEPNSIWTPGWAVELRFSLSMEIQHRQKQQKLPFLARSSISGFQKIHHVTSHLSTTTQWEQKIFLPEQKAYNKNLVFCQFTKCDISTNFWAFFSFLVTVGKVSTRGTCRRGKFLQHESIKTTGVNKDRRLTSDAGY